MTLVLVDIFPDKQADPALDDVGFDGPAPANAIKALDYNGRHRINAVTFPAAIGVPVISVKALGATGNGVTDDSLHFRNAIAAAIAGGGEVFVPPGVYIVSRDLVGGTFSCLPIDGVEGFTIRGVRGQSIIKQAAPVGIDATSIALFKVTNSRHVVFRDLVLDGNWGNAQTTVAFGSDGATLPQATLNVASTVDFPSAGTFELVTPTGFQTLSYTGKTSTSFTGCTGGIPGTVLRGDSGALTGGRFGYVVGRQSSANTHVAVASDGAVLPQATLNVGNTIAFSTSGQCFVASDVGAQLVTYTGKTSTTFTGCTGGTGTVNTGNGVWGAGNGLNQITQRDAQNRAIWLYGKGGDVVDVQIVGVDIRQMYGDGIWIGGDGTGGAQSGAIGGTRDVVIRDCTIDMCGRNGITLSYARGVRIHDCVIKNVITTAIDTEPVNGECVNVVIAGNTCSCWWNPWVDPVKNVLSVQGGVVATPAEWNYAQGYRVLNNRLFGCVLVSNALDVRFTGNSVYCDFDATSASPILMLMYNDDVWIESNYVYARSTDGFEQNIGAIQVVRQIIDGVSATMTAGVHIRGNRLHVRNGMDGISLVMPGGGGGFHGTATSVTGLTLVQTGAGWTISQFLGHQVVCGGVVAVIASNTSDTLTLAPWHADALHGWADARGQPQNPPATGVFVIQPTGGLVEVIDNVIDCVASDGRPAGRYGISVNTTTTWNPFFLDARIAIERNTIRGANPHAVHVFLYAAPPIKYLAIVENYAYDPQPVPTCSHVVFMDNNAGSFDPVAQVTKLIIRGNRQGESVPNNMGGISQGYWIVEDGLQQRFTGYGSPLGVIAAPVGSAMVRKDGGANSTLYVKEAGGLFLDGVAKTDQTGSALATDQVLTLDAVTTSSNNCLVVQVVTAVTGSGSPGWDQWTNALLAGFTEIVQDTDSGSQRNFAAAAGVLATAGSSGVGTVRQHAGSAEFGNGTYSFAVKPQVSTVPPVWISNGVQIQDGVSPVSVSWPVHQENDVAVMLIVLSETDTGAVVVDPQWIEFPSSPVLGQFSSVGVKMHLYGARAFKVDMPDVVVSHGGSSIMGAIMLFRGAVNGSTAGWVAK